MIAAVACCAPDQLTGELAGDPAVGPLIERFLRTPRYDPPLAFDLVALARGRTGASWALRRLAVLMLEHQALGLLPDDDARIAALLQTLGLGGEPRAVFLDLTRRLDRLHRVHRGIDGADTSDAALARFIEASRSDCKLTLSRYLFSPAEVVDRIVKSFTTSTGVRDSAGLGQPFVPEELAESLERLPPYEAAIVRGLSRRPTVYWVTPDTGSRINGLVEHPHDTVVAVIKPPGSDQEIEIKRVGLRQPEPLHAVFDRDGKEVPATHRIQGGSMGYYLRWEAAAAASLAQVHRRIQRDEAPISRTAAMSTIYGVPCDGGERHIVDYFARLAGPSGREQTRHAMRASIHAFCKEMRSQSLPARSDLELGAQFLGQVAPTQSVLIGTSSFRLESDRRLPVPGGRRLLLRADEPGRDRSRAPGVRRRGPRGGPRRPHARSTHHSSRTRSTSTRRSPTPTIAPGPIATTWRACGRSAPSGARSWGCAPTPTANRS